MRLDIRLWRRNKSWPRGATNFILANKSWPRDSAERVCVCLENKVRSSNRNMKSKNSKGEAIKVAVIGGIFALLAALIGRPWVCTENNTRKYTIQVLDSNTRLGVSNVWIQIEPIKYNGVTNDDGMCIFTTNKMQNKILKVSLSKDGYLPQVIAGHVDSLDLRTIFISKAAVYDSLFVGPK